MSSGWVVRLHDGFSRAGGLRLARRLGFGWVRLIEGRVSVGSDFAVTCFWVGGLDVFGVHNCDLREKFLMSLWVVAMKRLERMSIEID